MKSKIIVTVSLLAASMLANAGIGNLATQQICHQTLTRPPNNNAVWNSPTTFLDRSLDRKVYRRDIVAYKIKWSTGWSDWFVKGVNDLDVVTQPSGALSSDVDARLMWIYFWDHEHMYIYCS